MSRIRIVGGIYRSRQIEVPTAIALRPTPDRVRETLFNWLGQDLSGLSCLDLFAGSGALGFEAASRGATRVVMVEAVPRVATQLRKSLATLGAGNVQIMVADAIEFLEASGERFDVVFLDPPYREGWLERLEPHLAKVLQPDARVYVESEHAVTRLGALATYRTGRAGQVHFQLLAPPDEGSPGT